MVSISIPPLLALGFLIGMVLLILGYREEINLRRRNLLMGSGLGIIGIMVLLTPLSWFLYLAAIYGGTVIMTSSDIVILSILSFAGGIIMGVGIIIALKG